MSPNKPKIGPAVPEIAPIGLLIFAKVSSNFDLKLHCDKQALVW